MLQGRTPVSKVTSLGAYIRVSLLLYLLSGVEVVRVNKVWSTDITYIRLASCSAYLLAIIDWYSRRVLSRRI